MEALLFTAEVLVCTRRAIGALAMVVEGPALPERVASGPRPEREAEPGGFRLGKR